jgi:hypothetical protein
MAVCSTRLRDARLSPCGKVTPSVDVRKGTSVVVRSNGSNRPQMPFHRRGLGLQFLGFLPSTFRAPAAIKHVGPFSTPTQTSTKAGGDPPISRCRECRRARSSTKSRRPESSLRSHGHLEKLISMPIADLASVNISESEREQSRIIRRQFCGERPVGAIFRGAHMMMWDPTATRSPAFAYVDRAARQE